MTDDEYTLPLTLTPINQEARARALALLVVPLTKPVLIEGVYGHDCDCDECALMAEWMGD
jgi:ABC-type transport system involved in cytochrome c biogenesis permease component